jgi:hypothetical protein
MFNLFKKKTTEKVAVSPYPVLDEYAKEVGAVRDPNGYYMFTPQELWEFTLHILGDTYVYCKQNPNCTAKDAIEVFKE